MSAAQLGKEFARRGMRLKEAQRLFDAMYVADALNEANGDVQKAADQAGVHKKSLMQLRTRHRREEWEA